MSYDLIFQKALALHEQGLLDEAAQLYLQILEVSPHNPDILNLLGLISQNKGLHPQAVEYFYQAIQQTPQFAPLYFNLGISLQALSKPYEAIEAFIKNLELVPQTKESHLYLGKLYETINSPDLALSCYRQALSLDANYIEAQTELARFQRNNTLLKQLNTALSLYYLALTEQNLDYANQAEKLDNTNDKIKTLLGFLLLKASKTDLAKQKFIEARRLNPQNIDALINLSNIYTTEKLYLEAEKLYKQALDLSPHNLDAHLNYADMLYRANRIAEALEEYRKAVIISPFQPEISNNLGIILKEQAEYTEALGLFFNALNLDKNKEEYSINIVETVTLLAHKDYNQALQIAENWLKNMPDNLFAQHLAPTLKGENCENNQIYNEKLFNHFADTYELVLQRIGYHTPRTLRNFIGDVKGTIMDIGCGSGLVGEAFKTSGTELIGVDISSQMLQKAQDKQIYKRLIKADLNQWLPNYKKDISEPLSLAIAADVFCYFADFTPFLQALYPMPLAFSVETTQEDTSKLGVSGRYQHNPEQIMSTLKKIGYQHIQSQNLILRKENNKDVQGCLFYAKP